MAEISPSAVNASIPLAAKGPQIDPLEMVGKITQVQGGQLSNKLLGRQITSADLGIEGQGIANERAGVGLTSDQTALSGAQNKVMSEFLAGIAENPNMQTKDAIGAAIKQWFIDTGLIKPDNPSLNMVFSRLADGDSPEARAQNKALAVSLFLATHPDTAGRDYAQGPMQTIDTGPSKVSIRAGGISPPETVMAVKNALSPQDKVALTAPVVDPQTGISYPRSVSQVFDPYGNVMAGADAAGAPGGTGGGAPRDGRYHPPGGAPGTLGPSSLAPGGADIKAKSAATFNDDMTLSPDLKRVLTTFDQGFAAIQKAKTGPGSEALQNLRGIADTYGIPLPVITSKDETVAYQEADKWLSSALSQEASRLGLGTDQARELQKHAQPGVHTVHDAAVAMIPVLKGLKAMEYAAPLIAKAQGVAPQDYVEWRAGWAQSVDPLAFGADLMPAADRKRIYSAMTLPQKEAYKAGILAAETAGLFTRDVLRK